MALGNTSLKTVSTCNDNIKIEISYGNETLDCVYSCWNTFDYVSKNLSAWADETTIGAEVKQQMTQLSNALLSLMDSTNKLNTKVSSFISNQEHLNSGM